MNNPREGKTHRRRGMGKLVVLLAGDLAVVSCASAAKAVKSKQELALYNTPKPVEIPYEAPKEIPIPVVHVDYHTSPVSDEPPQTPEGEFLGVADAKPSLETVVEETLPIIFTYQSQNPETKQINWRAAFSYDPTTGRITASNGNVYLIDKEGKGRLDENKNDIADISDPEMLELFNVTAKKAIASTQAGLERITISGDENFTAQVQIALDLIREKTPDLYRQVQGYIDKIKQFQGSSGITPPTKIFYVNDKDETVAFYSSIEGLSGIIIHEVFGHSMPYWNNETYSGQLAELKGIQEQIKFLKRINGPAYLIKYLEGLDGNHYKDYLLRANKNSDNDRDVGYNQGALQYTRTA